MENITTKVEIADHTGHTIALLTQRETVDLVSDMSVGFSLEDR